MKRRIMAALAALGLFALAGCASYGYDADYVKDQPNCYQIEKWHSNGWTTTSQAIGVYCKAEVRP